MASTLAPKQSGAGWTFGKNRLLGSLDAVDLERISGQLEVDDYGSGHILYAPNRPAKYVYFPFSCVVSIVNTVAAGNSVEVGTVGNEGMAGIAEYLASEATPNRTLVQVPGQMARLRVDVFHALAESSPRFRLFLNKYTLAFLAQVSQTAACNGAHAIDERCARWLLMTHDRVDAESFSLTHEFLAYMLGVRRAGVTVAAGILQKAGLITYKRGNIKIVNRQGLEEASCDCYRIVREEFERLLGAA